MHLLQLQQQLKTLRSLRVQAAAVSVEPTKTAALAAKQMKLQYPILVDTKHQVIEAFGAYAPQERFSLPALFLIDRRGKILLGRVGVAHGPFDESAIPKAIEMVKAKKA